MPPINLIPIPLLNTGLHFCRTMSLFDQSGRHYKDSELLAILHAADTIDALPAQTYTDGTGKQYSAAEALLYLIEKHQSGAFNGCNLPVPFLTSSFEIQDAGGCPISSPALYSFEVINESNTVLSTTTAAGGTLIDQSEDLVDAIHYGILGAFCGGVQVRAFDFAVNGATSATQFRINGGAGVAFAPSIGHDIFSAMWASVIANSVTEILQMNYSNTANICHLLADNSVISIEYYNGAAWVALGIPTMQSSTLTCTSECFTATAWATNCGEIGAATIEGTGFTVKNIPIRLSDGSTAVFDDGTALQIFSPFNSAPLGYAINAYVANTILNNDPAKPAGVVVYNVENDPYTGLISSTCLYGSYLCDDLPTVNITVIPQNGVTLSYDSALNFSVLPPTNIAGWNTFFDTATFADTPFSSAIVIDNRTVLLQGATNIKIKTNLFKDNTHITRISDKRPYTGTTVLGHAAFKGATGLQFVSLPHVINVAGEAFMDCPLLLSIELNSVSNLGGTAGDDNVFAGSTGMIRFDVNVLQQTINVGNPDGDVLEAITLNPAMILTYTP